MTSSHGTTLQRANAAISEGDFEGFLVHCTDDTEWTFVGDRVLQGKDAVRAWMRATYRQPPTFEVHRMIVEGDTLVAVGEITLTDAAGAATHHAYCDVWQFRDGRMAALQAFVVELPDAAEALQAHAGSDSA